MKKIILLSFLLLSFGSNAQLKICSWNIQDLGTSKTSQDIAFLAETLSDFDIVAIQEVVAGPGGAQAVARLADELNRKGAKWTYAISNPTKSSPYSSERYAYVWKTSRVKIIGKAWLDTHFIEEIEREPYLIKIQYKGEEIILVNFHAIPTKKQPETEIKYFKNYPRLFPENTVLFLGDFNLPDTHTVFIPLKKLGYTTAFTQQKTSLKTKCNTQLEADCLSKSYDHFVFPKERLQLINSGVIHFYKNFVSIELARNISDHVPIWMEVEFNLNN